LRGFTSVNQICSKKRLIFIVVSYSDIHSIFSPFTTKHRDVATEQKQKPQHLHPEQAKTSKQNITTMRRTRKRRKKD